MTSPVTGRLAWFGVSHHQWCIRRGVRALTPGFVDYSPSRLNFEFREATIRDAGRIGTQEDIQKNRAFGANRTFFMYLYMFFCYTASFLSLLKLPYQFTFHNNNVNGVSVQNINPVEYRTWLPYRGSPRLDRARRPRLDRT